MEHGAEKSGKTVRRAFIPVVVLMAVLCATSAEAQAWWNDKWEARKKIVLDTTAPGAGVDGAVGEIPVCLRLHSGNLDFQRIKRDGSDIRFVAGDDATVLKHNFEWFDAVDQMAIVWVKIPKLAANAKQDFIWMYYGNPEAPKAEDSGGVFDKNQLVDFHFAEMQGPPKDSTAYGNHAAGFTGAQGLPSILGKGIALAGGNDKLTIQSTPALDLAGGFTFTAWVKMAAAQVQETVLLARENGEGSLVVGIDKTRLFCRVKNGKEETLMTGPNAEVKPGDWHQVAVTAEHKGKVTLFIDGAKVYDIDLSAVLPNLTTEIVVGNTAAGGKGFAGELDEVGLANVPRGEAWIKALYAAQIPQAKLAAFQGEEAHSGGGSMALAYIAVVIKNITPAGWAIIAITLSILAWCVVIFADKVMLLRGIKKGHQVIEETAAGVTDLLKVKLPEEYRETPLGRIHQAGMTFLDQRLKTCAGATVLPEQALAPLRFELHRAAVRENQMLTGKLVIMTIGIAGGPFLGLFGTVWGVMETFAAMAMVGEANIMAIAPGVASALGCTVVGLFLAIPCLFGYNFITTQIKNVMADISLYIDRFGANMEEHYRPQAHVADESYEQRRAIS